MESGGKAVTKRYRKKITVALSLVLPVIVLFAILNCITAYEMCIRDSGYTRNRMREMGFRAIFLYGDPDYSSRCGFVPAETLG